VKMPRQRDQAQHETDEGEDREQREGGIARRTHRYGNVVIGRKEEGARVVANMISLLLLARHHSSTEHNGEQLVAFVTSATDVTHL
jgi:hypothetical protein